MNKSQNQKFLTVKEFADAIGVHDQTIRIWDKTGKLKAHHKTPSGRRFYTQEQVTAYFNNEYARD